MDLSQWRNFNIFGQPAWVRVPPCMAGSAGVVVTPLICRAAAHNGVGGFVDFVALFLAN